MERCFEQRREVCQDCHTALDCYLPRGINGWADYRRTGYPKLFKNDVNYSQGEIDTDLGPRRLPFTLAEKTTNPDYADAVSKLGGPDNAGTRVFWDIDKPNF